MTLPLVLHSGEGQSIIIGTSKCTFKLTGKEYFIGLSELRKNGRQPTSEELLDLMQKFDRYPAE